MKNKPFQIILIISILLVITFKDSIFDTYIKKKDIYGISFNNERRKHHLIELDKHWKIDAKTNENFKISWLNKSINSRHKRKTIEYDFDGIKTETDIYENPKEKDRIYYSVYNFRKDIDKIQYYYDV